MLSKFSDVEDDENTSEGKDKTMKFHVFDIQEHIAIEDVIVEQKSDSCQQDALETQRNSKHNY